MHTKLTQTWFSRSPACALFVFAAMGGAVSGCNAQSTGAQASTPGQGQTKNQTSLPLVGKLLQMSKEQAEEALGQPASTEQFTTPVSGKMVSGLNCSYQSAVTKNLLRIEWQLRGDKYKMVQFSATFDKDVDWKKAAEIVGLKPSSLKFKQYYKGSGELTGHSLNDWSVAYSGFMSRAPSNGVLDNEDDNGLPRITFFLKSLWGG